jgi:hypothetical protein
MKVLNINSINVTKGDGKGEVNITWDSVEKADRYLVQYCIEKKKKWVLADITNEPNYTLNGLNGRKTYYFRVAAVNSEIKGPWSDPVKKKLGR